MLDGIIVVDGDVRGAAAKIHQGHADFLLFLGQHGLGRSQRFENYVLHAQIGTVAAVDDIFCAGYGSRHDMDIDLKPDAGHADRINYAALVVDNEFLGKRVNDFAVRRNVDSAGSLKYAGDIGGSDFLSLDGNNAMAVDAHDMTAGNAHVY